MRECIVHKEGNFSMSEKKVREKKKPSFFLAVLPILAMILLLGVGYAVMGLSPEVLMLVSAAVAAVIAVSLGYTLPLLSGRVP